MGGNGTTGTTRWTPCIAICPILRGPRRFSKGGGAPTCSRLRATHRTKPAASRRSALVAASPRCTEILAMAADGCSKISAPFSYRLGEWKLRRPCFHHPRGHGFRIPNPAGGNGCGAGLLPVQLGGCGRGDVSKWLTAAVGREARPPAGIVSRAGRTRPMS